MRIDILTLFPSMVEAPLSDSIIKRGLNKGLVEIVIHNIRDYTTNKHKKVDDYPYSGEAGMVMTIQPIADLIEKLKKERDYDEIIYTTPDGKQFCQAIANEMSMLNNIIILCGHYKGVDYRIREHYITREISIGDYVISGGELAAAVIADAVIRVIPNVLSDETSALTDSFQDNLLSAPVYTRPVEFNGWKVPEILLSGNAKLIEQWRMEQSLERTKRLRPDLLKD